MKNRLKLNYYIYFQWYHLGGICLAVIISQSVMNPAQCVWYITEEAAANIEENMRETFSVEGYENPSVYIETKIDDGTHRYIYSDNEIYKANQERSKLKVFDFKNIPEEVKNDSRLKLNTYIPQESLNAAKTMDIFNRIIENLNTLERSLKEKNYPLIINNMPSPSLLKGFHAILPPVTADSEFYTNLETKQLGTMQPAIEKLYQKILVDNNETNKYFIIQYNVNCYIYTQKVLGEPIDPKHVEILYWSWKSRLFK